jgi:hypothetical protein
MVLIGRRLIDDFPELQFLHAGHGLAEQVIHGDRVDQGRIQSRLQVMPVHPGDRPPGRFQLQLPAQTELGIQPPTLNHDRSSSSASTV